MSLTATLRLAVPRVPSGYVFVIVMFSGSCLASTLVSLCLSVIVFKVCYLVILSWVSGNTSPHLTITLAVVKLVAAENRHIDQYIRSYNTFVILLIH